MTWQEGLAADAKRDPGQPIEPCPALLARTDGKKVVTDDNMGSEWLHFLGLE